MNEVVSVGSISFCCVQRSSDIVKKSTYNQLKYYLLFVVLLVTVFNLNAGNLTGYVFSLNSMGNKAPLSGAYVYSSNPLTGTITDATGQFTLKKEDTNSTYLIATFEGFNPDTIQVKSADNQSFEFVLKEEGY